MAQMVKILPAMQETQGSIPGLGRSPGEGNGNLLQYSCLEKSHAQRSLVEYSPWGHKESNMTEGLIEGDREKKRKRERGSGAQDWN